MADILISKFTTQIPRVGATPATPGFAESEGQDPVNPSGTPQVYTPVTIGSPANGLSIDGSQVLTIGLASTSATGALSSTDWNTFNGKIGGSGTTNYLAKFTASGTIGDSAVFESGGNVGIGISPLSRLTIHQFNDTFEDGIAITRIGADRGTVFLNSLNNTLNIGRAGNTFVSITDIGRFGISTTSPTNTLDVNGTTRIRTINNLGTAATSVLVPSATGVVSLRTLAEFASDLGAVTITGTQTITGIKTFNADFNIGNTALDYVSWDNTSKTFGIFSQVQFLHKYRGGASGALNIGQYDVNGNASINNTSNAALLFGTNNTTRIEVEADGDVLLKKVDNGTGNFVTIDASTGQLRKRTASEAASDLGVGQSFSTFTPTATASGGGGTYSVTDSVGQIYTNGDLVIIYIAFNITSSGSPSGNLEIGGITGSYGISGIVGGEIRVFSGSNVSATDLRILYPNNVDSPLTKLKIRRKGAGTDVTGITFTSGTVELWYQFRKS